MPLTGKLRTWNDDRGYGFIAPTHGGRELFVHISAFPRDGSHPTVGETLTYELGAGKDGKPQAVKVFRQALGRPVDYPNRPERGRAAPSKTRRAPAFVGVLLVVAAAAYGYRAYQSRVSSTPSPSVEGLASSKNTPAPRQVEPAFHCDGRTHCSHMTSCAEAKFFLENCPGTKMDGNRDGVPCEQQWCTHPLAD